MSADLSDYSLEQGFQGVSMTHDHCGEVVSHPAHVEEAVRDAENHDEECEG